MPNTGAWIDGGAVGTVRDEIAAEAAVPVVRMREHEASLPSGPARIFALAAIDTPQDVQEKAWGAERERVELDLREQGPVLGLAIGVDRGRSDIP